MLRSLGKGEAAQTSYQQALDLRERLARAEPNRAHYQWDLAASLQQVPSYDPAAGPAALRRALDILGSLKARGALLPRQEWGIADLERRLAEISGKSE